MTITRLSGFQTQILGVKVHFFIEAFSWFQGGGSVGAGFQQVEEVSEMDDDEEAEISYDTDFD